MALAAGLGLIEYDTAWGPGWMVVDHAGNVLRVGVPGSVPPEGDATPSHGDPPEDAAAVAKELARRLQRYFERQDVELASTGQVTQWLEAAGVHGFRLQALLELHAVPRGTTITYGELAEIAGRPRAARAVGSACAHNPLPIVVPCHRVVAAGGRIGAYSGMGSAYKQRLLELEQAPPAGSTRNRLQTRHRLR